MKKEFRLPKLFTDKWVKALRSGEYTQGHFRLCQNGKYCCLGVACNIAGHQKTLNIDEDMQFVSIKQYNNVPKELKGVLELPKVLSEMNDHGNRGFKYIATWIEKNVELY